MSRCWLMKGCTLYDLDVVTLVDEGLHIVRPQHRQVWTLPRENVATFERSEFWAVSSNILLHISTQFPNAEFFHLKCTRNGVSDVR